MSESSGEAEQVKLEAGKPESVQSQTGKPETSESQTGQSEAKSRNGRMPLTIYLHWCKACGICISFCPHQVFTADRDGKPIIAYGEKCTQCAICWLHCPDLAIVSNEK